MQNDATKDGQDPQAFPVPQTMPQPYSSPLGASGGQPIGAQTPPAVAPAYPTSPLQPGPPSPLQSVQAGPFAQNTPGAQSGQGLPAFTPPPISASPLTAIGNAAPPATTASLDDDKDTPVDDVVWVNRAKRVIAETQGDPHRQVQLMQHLRATYLKQRYGRSIHTDDQQAGQSAGKV